jgi:GTP cyclohydrolase I
VDLEIVEDSMRRLIKEGLGLDLSDPNLSRTPQRVAEMYCKEFFANIGREFDGVTCFPAESKSRDIIMFDNIDFVSVCSHHFLPFTGRAWLLYIPKDQIVGASKPARIISHYAKRPQLQERLCRDVINCFNRHVQPEGSMVFMRAIHQCMSCRGAKQSQKSGMATSAVEGVFLTVPNMELKALEMIKLSTTMILS